MVRIVVAGDDFFRPLLGRKKHACCDSRRIDPAVDGSIPRQRASGRAMTRAAMVPTSCAATNPPMSTGRMPANVWVSARASVTAGFANDVLAVNQYAAKIQHATS